MEDTGKYPSLPSNYVTLVQLHEKWIREQQLKQTQKEQQQQQQKREQQQTISKPNDRRQFWRNSRNRSEIDRRMIQVTSPIPKPEESQVEAVVVISKEIHDQEPNTDESKMRTKKKWRKKKKKKKKREAKTTTEEDLTGGTPQSLPENEHEENLTGVTATKQQEKEEEERIPVVVVERNGEKKGVRSEFQWRSKKPVAEQEAPVDRAAEIGRKFEDVSVSMTSGKEKGSDRSTAAMNRDRRKYNGSRRFARREVWKSRESGGLVWVIKGEASDGNAAGIRSSGGSRRRD